MIESQHVPCVLQISINLVIASSLVEVCVFFVWFFLGGVGGGESGGNPSLD